MANSDKDILITPNKGTSSIPEVSFVGQVNSPIKLRVLDDNTLSFEGSAGQLFSINNNLTTGTIFAVSDVSGVPSLSVDASGYLNAVPFNGVLTVGSNNSTFGNTAKVAAEIRGRAPGGEDPVALSTTPNGSLIVSTSGTGVLAHMGIQANTTPQYAWLQVRHSSNGAAYNYTLQPLGGYTGFYEKPISRVSIATDGTGGDSRQLTIYNKGQSLISFGSYPASWSSSLMIQNNNNTDFVWISPLDDGYNARFRTGGTGLDFYTGGGNDTGTLALQLDTSGNVGVKGNTNGSYALNITGNVNFSGDLYQAGAIFKTLPTQTATTDGSVLRTRFNSSTSAYEAYWTHDLDANYRLENPDQWAFRYIINRGYTVAGYQNANPWRNGNRTAHASDVTISIGDVIDYSAAYIGGSHNGVNLFVYNCANSWLPASAATCSMSMITETNRGLRSSWNDTRARSYSGAWLDFMGNQWRNNAGRNRAYISSGNGNTSRHDLNTESMITEIGGTISYVAHAEGEFYAWVSQGQNRFEFSSETFTSWSSYSPAPGCDGINKHQATRIGFFYASEGGNTNRSVTKRRDSDAVILRSGISKPESGGEENLHTGMNKGYCISNYNYAQNNNAWIYQYYNDVIRFADGTLTYRKGIPGASSGTGQEGGDMMGAGVAPRTYMTYAGGQQVAPGTMAYGGSTGATQQGGAAVADGSGATGGIGTY
jgi:hypothetical protein